MPHPSHAPAETAPAALRRVREQGIAYYLAQSGKILAAARRSPDVAEVLATYGYGDDEFAEGMTLLEAADKELAGNRLEPGAGDFDDLANAAREAHDDFEEFRQIARANFRSGEERGRLRVDDDVPDDLQKLINAAHLAYRAARLPEFAEKLAKRGYPEERLARLDAALESLSRGGRPLPEVIDEEADEGEEAYFLFKEWMKEFRGTAFGALLKRPEMRAEIGL